MRKFVYLVTLIFLLSIASSASAFSVYRAGAGSYDPCDPQPWMWQAEVSSAWSDGNNWVYWASEDPWGSVQTCPTSSDLVMLNRGPSYPVLIDSGTDADADVLEVGFWDNLDVTLSVTGGTLDTIGRLSVGSGGPYDNHNMNISGGVITVGGPLAIGSQDPYATGTSGYGNAVVQMTGGTVDVTGDLEIGNYGGKAIMTLFGGTLTTESNFLMTAKGKLYIGGDGKLRVQGNEVSTIQGYLDNDYIIATGTPTYITDSGHDDYTYTTLIPEPATLTLLGIGGLALLRRKR